MKRIITTLALSLLIALSSMAQGYKRSIGAVLGMTNGVSYKRFISNNVAIQSDLGFGINYAAFSQFNATWTLNCWDFSISPQIMYQGNITGNLYAFGGAGLTLGEINNYSSNACIGGKFGVNAIMGLEYQLPAPLTLGLDFRPGYGLFFDQDYNINAFDWKLVVALRYTL